MTPARAPRVARMIAAFGIRSDRREFVLGDLEEQFAERSQTLGTAKARRWFWRQVGGVIRHRGRARRSAEPVGRRRGDSFMHQITRDISYAWRQLRRQPSYAAVAVLSMALAIAANGIVYGVVDNLVLNPFQFHEPDRLVSIGSAFPRLGDREGFIEAHSPAEIDDFRRATSLTQVAAFDLGNRAVSNGAVSERVFTALLLDDPIPALGTPPALGRGFTEAELGPIGPTVAILSHRLWRSMFGGDPAIVGSTIRMGGQPLTVVGVAGEGASLLGTDLWIPWGGHTDQVPRNRRQFTLVARLAPGATVDDANAEMAALTGRTAAAFGAQFPEYSGWRLRVATWTEAVTGELMTPARILLAAGWLVLLIACANLTGLLLARLNARRREIAVRYALGAGSWQVTRLLLVESLAVAVAATGLGLFLANLGIGIVPSMLPTRVINLGAVPEIDYRVMAYCALVAVAAAVATTLVPAWHARRGAGQLSLREGGKSRSRQRMRTTLVVVELAMAVVLLMGAGLMLRSFSRIQQVDPGFDTSRLLTMRLTVSPQQYDEEGIRRFFIDAVSKLEALPNITAAAATAQLPPQEYSTISFRVDGAAPPTDTLPTAYFTSITPGLFEVWGVGMRSGRALDDRDREGAPLAVVVNETFVRRFLDGQPRGRLLVGENETAVDIVGVVADVRNDSLLTPARPEIFVNHAQAPYNNQLFLVMRTHGETADALPSVLQALIELDPDQPPYVIQTMDQAMAGSVSSQRVSLTLVSAFAAVSVLIAGIGVFGVVSYWVSARSREIGIRLALGATTRQVSGLVMGQTARLVVTGAVLGIVGGVFAGRLAQSILFETSATDPVALGGVVLLLVAIGLAAAHLPSRRAAAVDPVRALRVD